MRTYAAQASTAAGHGRHGPSSGRRSVPTGSVRLIHRPVRQRWCERPRCPALRVAPAPCRGGRSHHRWPCWLSLAVQPVSSGETRRPPVCARRAVSPDNPPDKSARTLGKSAATSSEILATNAVPIARLHHRAIDSRAVLGVVNALRCASTRPRPGLRALTTPPRGTTWAIARWPAFDARAAEKATHRVLGVR